MKTKNLYQIFFAAICVAAIFASCSGSKVKNDIAVIEKCLGDIKTEKQAKKLSKEEAVTIAKCMLPHMEAIKDRLDNMSSEEREKYNKELDEAVEKSEYKEMIKGMDYDTVKELADNEDESSSSDVSSSFNSNTAAIPDFTKSFEGTINGKYGIIMTLTKNTGNLSGTYTYKSQGTPIKISGTIADNGNLTINEFNDKGNMTGVFKGQLNSSNIIGQWTKPDGSKKMPFSISESTNNETTTSTTENSDNTSATTEEPATTSSSDCDQFIRNYENFVDNYIKVMKKYKANPSDPTILSEYTEMASQAASMHTKVNDCTDTKFAAKLAKLSAKIASALY